MTIAYEGTGFHGFARQEGFRTVQGVIEQALATVLRTPIVTVGAGRTDAGVHATGQVMSFEYGGELADAMERRLTALAGPEVSVLSVAPADEGFNARFSARWRRYRYRILARPQPDPLRRLITWHVPQSLDVGAMHDNVQAAVGEHDFVAFCRVRDGGHARRRVLDASVAAAGDEVHVVVRGTAFCHQMVRSLVGAAVAGRSIGRALVARDRSMAGSIAPPHGLCLEDVGYE